MLMEQFIESVDILFKEVVKTQKGNMVKAGDLIVEAVKGGASVHMFDTGHIVNNELFNRAGGLALLKGFTYALNINDPVRVKDQSGKNKSMEGLTRYALRQSNVMPGDVLIVASVSGKSVNVIDLAIEAQEMGVKVITICAFQYSSALSSDHSSGKKLYELGDVAIDNCAPKGDAMIEVKGVENKFGPASGLSAAYIMWCISALVVEKLLEAGLTPTLFKSINFPDGKENYDRMCKQYEQTGM